jgi:hypothetical protein
MYIPLRRASIRRAAILAVCSLLTAASALIAELRQFPYSATVRTEEVEVRAGPGQRYYVTGKLRLNDAVTVHRHDPGGWYMIAPPPGSFSWIDASLVRKTADNRGVVEVPPGSQVRALVRMGSQISDEHSYYGRELADGDEVEILGEKTLNNEQGAIRMYKIAPPPLEYRWAKGDYIIAAGESAPAPQVAAAPAPSPNPAPKTSPASLPAPAESAPPVAADSRNSSMLPKDRLAELDVRYIELTRQSPEDWDIAGLRADYEALRPNVDAMLAQQIDERLKALASREVILTEYQEFAELASATTRRDQALKAMQASEVVPAGGFTASGGPQLPSQPAPQSPPPQPFQAPAEASPIFPELDGAGIVRAANSPTGPGHVLTDLNGKILAVLRAAQGVDLNAWIGKSVGVVGERRFDSARQTDVIEVRQFVPVQLAPTLE